MKFLGKLYKFKKDGLARCLNKTPLIRFVSVHTRRSPESIHHYIRITVIDRQPGFGEVECGHFCSHVDGLHYSEAHLFEEGLNTCQDDGGQQAVDFPPL